jgi:hypothetical protein
MRREQRAFALLLLDRACTGRSDPRSARNRYAAAGAFSVHDRSNDQVARSFLAFTSVNAFVTGRHKLRPSGTSPPTERRLSIRPSSGRPLLQVRVLRRRPEWLRSLQGRVTIATSAPKHRMVSAMLTDKRLEYCTGGAPLQGSVRRNGGCKPKSTAFRVLSVLTSREGDRSGNRRTYLLSLICIKPRRSAWIHRFGQTRAVTVLQCMPLTIGRVSSELAEWRQFLRR